MLYMPVIVLLSEWFVRKRGLAAGIIFAGSGIGGMLPNTRTITRSFKGSFSRVRIPVHGEWTA